MKYCKTCLYPDTKPDLLFDEDGVCSACRPIVRDPLSVGPVEWLPEQSVGDEVVALLPRGRVTLDRETEAALVRAFGTDGEFEARRC